MSSIYYSGIANDIRSNSLGSKQLIVFTFKLQKARLARIQIAKATSGAAFVSKKKAAEAKMAERAANGGEEAETKEDIFEMQHHHLLRCLEKTTVSI